MRAACNRRKYCWPKIWGKRLGVQILKNPDGEIPDKWAYPVTRITELTHQHQVKRKLCFSASITGRSVKLMTAERRNLIFRVTQNAKSPKRRFFDQLLTRRSIFNNRHRIFLGNWTTFWTPKCRSTKSVLYKFRTRLHDMQNQQISVVKNLRVFPARCMGDSWMTDAKQQKSNGSSRRV